MFQLLHFLSSDVTEDSEDCVYLVSCMLCDHRAIDAAFGRARQRCMRAYASVRRQVWRLFERDVILVSRLTVHGVCAQKAKQVL